ncbi:hypothetical protein GPALN_012326 [Globodera pallida]|nr:hypothetical protein GPALN_012325 [Globodera pallida]KAI3421783.1 hypothetical protein GPALN_012326 [Globodera pallida]
MAPNQSKTAQRDCAEEEAAAQQLQLLIQIGNERPEAHPNKDSSSSSTNSTSNVCPYCKRRKNKARRSKWVIYDEKIRRQERQQMKRLKKEEAMEKKKKLQKLTDQYNSMKRRVESGECEEFFISSRGPSPIHFGVSSSPIDWNPFNFFP